MTMIRPAVCALFLAAALPFSAFAAKVIVLCYHSFLDRPTVEYDVSPGVFTNQILGLERMGYGFVSLNDVISNRTKGDLNILLTFDDANRSIKAVWPFLKKRSIKPVIFVYPAIIGTMSYALTWDELGELAREGASIGGHGYNHLYVNEKLFISDNRAFRREIYQCADRIKARLSVVPVAYAYPFGIYSEITKQHLRLAGYRCAFTLLNGELNVPLEKNPDPFELRRYMVTISSWSWISGILKRRAAETGRKSAR